MTKEKINTHGVCIQYGKHLGEPFTRLPLSYLKWMINEKAPDYLIAKAELARRGDTMPTIDISGHAIDNASLRVRKQWHQTAVNKSEGLYTWLTRMTHEALENGERLEGDKYKYNGMKLVIKQGEEFPTLVTIM